MLYLTYKIMWVIWSYVNILDTKSQTFYAALLANNSHCSGVM